MTSFQRPYWSPAVWTATSKPCSTAGSESYDSYPRSFAHESIYTDELPLVLSLDLGQLSPFEPVADQFLALGLRIEGAIALQPSNPIFWTRQHAIVLMPTADRKSIDFFFQQPVQDLCVSVMGVREVRLIGIQCDRQHISRRSDNPNRLLSHPNDLLDPLQPALMEVSDGALTQVRLESSHPFVVTNVLYRRPGRE